MMRILICDIGAADDPYASRGLQARLEKDGHDVEVCPETDDEGNVIKDPEKVARQIDARVVDPDKGNRNLVMIDVVGLGANEQSRGEQVLTTLVEKYSFRPGEEKPPYLLIRSKEVQTYRGIIHERFAVPLENFFNTETDCNGKVARRISEIEKDLNRER